MGLGFRVELRVCGFRVEGGVFRVQSSVLFQVVNMLSASGRVGAWVRGCVLACLCFCV